MFPEELARCECRVVRWCVCVCLVGAQSSSNICLSVQANLYLLGKCVSVYVDVGVCVCGCVGVFVCVQKQNKQSRRSTARITRVNDTPRPVIDVAFITSVSACRADTCPTTLNLATPPWTVLHPLFQVLSFHINKEAHA
jgi:hypothetical protein